MAGSLRALWKGVIEAENLSVPVKLYTAVRPHEIHFKMLHDQDGQPVRQVLECPAENKEVPREHAVRGYEIRKDQYVIISETDLDNCGPEASRSIRVLHFVDPSKVDPIYFEKSYYLAPEDQSGAEKAYALLLKAMKEEGKVAIGRFVMRSKEYLAAIRPMDGVLVLETMFFPDEIRDASEVENVPVGRQAGDRELKMAKQLIGSLSTDWDPERYHDEYRERVLKLIRDKAKGNEVVLPEGGPAETKVRDLMDALRQSIEATKKGRRPVQAASQAYGHLKRSTGRARSRTPKRRTLKKAS